MDYTNVLLMGHCQNSVSEKSKCFGQKKITGCLNPKLKYSISKIIMLATEEIRTMTGETCLFKRCLSSKASRMCSICLDILANFN